MRESYERGELARIGLIPGGKNPAEFLTKSTVKENSPLMDLVRTNKLQVKPEGWAKVRKTVTEVNDPYFERAADCEHIHLTPAAESADDEQEASTTENDRTAETKARSDTSNNDQHKKREVAESVTCIADTKLKNKRKS